MDGDAVTRLRRVVTKLARELNASATSAGLTPTQASVLGLVAGRGPMGLAALIEFERINPTMLSRVVGKLEDAGLIRRIPDPNDLRAASIEITADGRDAYERVRSQRTAIVTDCTSELPGRQAEAITSALPALEELVMQLERRHRPASRSCG